MMSFTAVSNVSSIQRRRPASRPADRGRHRQAGVPSRVSRMLKAGPTSRALMWSMVELAHQGCRSRLETLAVPQVAAIAVSGPWH